MGELLTLTIADLERYAACERLERYADITRHLGRRPADDEAIPLRTWWDLPTTSVEDRWWSLRAAAPAPAAQILGVRAACRAARRVLHLPRTCDRALGLSALEAAEAWAADPTAGRARAWRAAAAAYADADAAYAADYGYAADDAADDAATAAAAYAYAADAADAYAAADAAYAAAAYAYTAAADAADAAAAAYAYAYTAAAAATAERAAQRADLDELLAEMEVTRG